MVAMGAGGGGAILIVAKPVFDSLTAVIVAAPAASALTAPEVASTLAIAGAEEDHCTERPVRILPAASRTTAVAVVVCPTVRAGLASATLTVATGTAIGGGTTTVPVGESEPPQ